MKNTFKKNISLLLALSILLSCMQFTVYAEENDYEYQTADQEDVNLDEEEITIEEPTISEDLQEEDINEETKEDLPSEEEDASVFDIDEEEQDIMLLDEVLEEYPLSGSVFDDVKDTDWFCPSVTFVLNKGIMTGKGNNKFVAAENICRADFAVILYRMSGSPEVNTATTFPDVPANAYYASAVAWASQESVGIIKGYQGGSKKGYFGSADSITREDMATMLFRYASYNEFDTSKSTSLEQFPDANKVSQYAEEPVQWAVGTGIITGDKGCINPQGKSNRAVCATMIQRFYNAFMKGTIANVDYTASCESVVASEMNSEQGTFKISVTNPTAAIGFDAVQTVAYSKEDRSDAYVYNLSAQGNNAYTVTADAKNHNYNVGTYTVEAYALIKNVRIFLASTTIDVEARQATVLINQYVNSVYNEVGRDLNKCYWWVVNNMSYQTLTIHLTPPEGYTRCENYALYAFQNHRGNCYCYAAAFYYLAKGLGYDAQYIEGQVSMAAGGYGPHGWVSIVSNGATYICDPEAQDEASLSRYNFYMQPKNRPVMTYIWP